MNHGRQSLQVFVSQVDLVASRVATADWPHTELGLDVNIFCRLFDEQAVWQYIQFSHRLGFSLITIYAAGNDGFHSVTIWTWCGMKEILDGNRCHKLTLTLRTQCHNWQWCPHSSRAARREKMPQTGPPMSYLWVQTFTTKSEPDSMHFWKIYWQLHFFGQASTQSPTLSLCSVELV